MSTCVDDTAPIHGIGCVQISARSHGDSMANTHLNRLGRLAAGLYGHTLLEMDVERRAPLPAGAKIIAPNHPATTDPFLMMGLVHEPISILITDMCFQVPLLGRYLRAAGHVPVVDGHGQAAFEEAVKRL